MLSEDQRSRFDEEQNFRSLHIGQNGHSMQVDRTSAIKLIQSLNRRQWVSNLCPPGVVSVFALTLYECSDTTFHDVLNI